MESVSIRQQSTPGPAKRSKELAPVSVPLESPGQCSKARFNSVIMRAARLQLPSVLGLTLGNCLPLHVARRVRTATRERDNVVDYVASARPAARSCGRAVQTLEFGFGAAAADRARVGLRYQQAEQDREGYLRCVTRTGARWEGWGFILIIVGMLVGMVASAPLSTFGGMAAFVGVVVFIIGRFK